MWLTWRAQCLRSRFAKLGARQQPTFFKQDKEVIVSPIALLKTVSRKKIWPFHTSQKILKTGSRSRKKAGRQECQLKNRDPQVIKLRRILPKDLICLRYIACLHTPPTYHLYYVSPYTKYLPLCIEVAVHAKAHGTQHGVVEVSCVHCTFAGIYSCRPTAKHT